MYIAIGFVVFVIYGAFMVATYERIHEGTQFEWDLLILSFFWWLLLPVVMTYRLIRWTAVGTGWIVRACYG